MPNLTLGELCHPAEMAVQMGRSLRELFPPLLSLSRWSAATCMRQGRSAMNYTPEHRGETNEAGSKFLSVQGRMRYV